jgi:hypothetical protein
MQGVGNQSNNEEINQSASNCHQLKLQSAVISIQQQPVGFSENARVAEEGAEVAKSARTQLEDRTGKSALSPLNAKRLGQRKQVSHKSKDET